MRILIVCSGNAVNFDFKIHRAFIYDQIEALCKNFQNVQYDTYFIKGKGIVGYINNIGKIKNKIKKYNPDIIHAHGGHTGLLCCLQRRVPVIVTFHGSDINYVKNRVFSIMTSLLSSSSIFVSEKLKKKLIFVKRNAYIIPCGVNLDVFYPVDKYGAKKLLEIPKNESYVLFSSSFKNTVKNFLLAQKAIVNFPDTKIREIKNRTREEVNMLINGAELLLMTSFSEGSPQVIKEAMACNCPIVSVDVGDVREVLGETDGTFLCSYDIEDVADKIKKALAFGKKTNGREKIKYLDNNLISQKIFKVYTKSNNG